MNSQKRSSAARVRLLRSLCALWSRQARSWLSRKSGRTRSTKAVSSKFIRNSIIKTLCGCVMPTLSNWIKSQCNKNRPKKEKEKVGSRRSLAQHCDGLHTIKCLSHLKAFLRPAPASSPYARQAVHILAFTCSELHTQKQYNASGYQADEPTRWPNLSHSQSLRLW